MSLRKVVFITGANTGLGYETVRALAGSATAYEILLGGRSIEKATKAAEEITGEFPSSPSLISPIQIDIESDESIETAVKEIEAKLGRLDALINNAGTQLDQQITAGTMTPRAAFNKTFDVNITGTHILTWAAAPLLLKSADPRLIFLISGTATLAGSEASTLPFNRALPSGWPKPPIIGVPAYRSSKTGLTMLMREWYRMVTLDGVKVWGVAPGYLATWLGGDQSVNKAGGAVDPALGGKFLRAVVEGERDADVGKVVMRQGGTQPW